MQDDNIRNKIESKIENLRLVFNDFIVTEQSRAWKSLAEYDVVPVSVASVLVNKGDQSTLDELELETKEAMSGIEKIQKAVSANTDDDTILFLFEDLKNKIFADQQLHTFEILRDNNLAENGLPAKTAFQKAQDKTWFRNYANIFQKFSNLIKDSASSFTADIIGMSGISQAKALPCFSGDYVRASSIVSEATKSLKDSISKLHDTTITSFMYRLHEEKVSKILSSYNQSIEQNQTLGRVDLDFSEWHKQTVDFYRKATTISEKLSLGITLKIPRISDFSQDFVGQFASPDYKDTAQASLDFESRILDYDATSPQEISNQEVANSIAYIAERRPEFVSRVGYIKPDFAKMECV